MHALTTNSMYLHVLKCCDDKYTILRFAIIPQIQLIICHYYETIVDYRSILSSDHGDILYSSSDLDIWNALTIYLQVSTDGRQLHKYTNHSAQLFLTCQSHSEIGESILLMGNQTGMFSCSTLKIVLWMNSLLLTRTWQISRHFSFSMRFTWWI